MRSTLRIPEVHEQGGHKDDDSTLKTLIGTGNVIFGSLVVENVEVNAALHPGDLIQVFSTQTRSSEEHKVVSVDGAAVTLERMVGLSTERLIQISLLRPTVSSTLHQVSDMLEDIGGAVGDDVPGGGESKQDALEDIVAPSEGVHST